jgi:hypothetical protein
MTLQSVLDLKLFFHTIYLKSLICLSLDAGVVEILDKRLKNIKKRNIHIYVKKNLLLYYYIIMESL